MDFHFWSLLSWFPHLRSTHACCFLLTRFHSLSYPGALWVMQSFVVSCMETWLWSGAIPSCLHAVLYQCRGKPFESLSNISSHRDAAFIETSSQTRVSNMFLSMPAHVAPPIVTFCPSSLWPPLPLYWLMTWRIEVPTITCYVRRQICLHILFFSSQFAVQTFFFFFITLWARFSIRHTGTQKLTSDEVFQTEDKSHKTVCICDSSCLSTAVFHKINQYF